MIAVLYDHIFKGLIHIFLMHQNCNCIVIVRLRSEIH